MKKGSLIVLEGCCDGIGKSTQYNLLYKKFLEENKAVYCHHFPSYNTKEGFGVESYLKGEYGAMNSLSPYFVNNLYAFDRAVTWVSKLKKEYEEGKLILLDRYTTSSLIYQSALIDDINGKNKFLDYISDYEYNKIGIKKPDKVIFLCAPFDLITNMREKRKSNEGLEKDIHEKIGRASCRERV